MNTFPPEVTIQEAWDAASVRERGYVAHISGVSATVAEHKTWRELTSRQQALIVRRGVIPKAILKAPVTPEEYYTMLTTGERVDVGDKVSIKSARMERWMSGEVVEIKHKTFGAARTLVKLQDGTVVPVTRHQIKLIGKVAIPKAEVGKGSTSPSERLGRGETLNNLLPMSPEEGPPLPKAFDLKWPWKK